MSFVQNLETTNGDEKDGVAIRQRLGGKETLVQWSNGRCRWVNTEKLTGKLSVNDSSKEFFDDSTLACEV